MLNRKRIYVLVGEKLKMLRRILIMEPIELSGLLGVLEREYLEYEEGYPIPPNILRRAIDWYGLELKEILPTINECSVMWVFNNGEAIHGKVRYRKTKDGVYRSVDSAQEYLRSYAP